MASAESPLWTAIAALPPRGAEQHRYLLVNQAAVPAGSGVTRSLQAFERMPLFGQSNNACEDGATPFVLRLDGQIGLTLATLPLRRLCAECCYASAISVLDTSAAILPLSQALTARCEARLSDGQDMVLRYFDTRVLEAVLDHFSPAQLSQLVSCTTQWRFAGRIGLLEPVTASPWPAADTFVPPWRLSSAQEHALLEASEADTMIDLLSRQNVEPLLLMPYPERYPVVSRLLAEAKAWGLQDISDQAAYCTLSLHHGTDLARVAPWPTLLPRVQRGELSFKQALEQAAGQPP